MKRHHPFWAGSLLIGLAIWICLFLSSPSFAQTTLNGVVSRNANLRSGPGTSYAIAGSAAQGQVVVITNRTAAGDWYQLSTGEWIAAFLVDVTTATPEGTAAQVTQIIDGDTIDVTIDGVPYRVRYILIDTPERGMPFFDEATAANSKLVQGKTVYLVKDVSETDRYGRLLRYVYLADGTFVNTELVRQGFAKLATFPPDVAKEAEIRAVQQDAVAAGRGLWAGTPQGTTVNRAGNLRSGPGTNYPIVGSAQSGQTLSIVAQNGAGDWLKLEDGKWIAAFLVNNAPTGLAVDGAASAQPVQEVPPTATPLPVPPTPTAAPVQQSCDPSYPTICIPPGVADLDCDEIPYRRFQVVGADPHRFDGDHDGIGCER